MPSVFDRVVAVDAGVDELFSYGGVTPEHVESLVHGAIFTPRPGRLEEHGHLYRRQRRRSRRAAVREGEEDLLRADAGFGDDRLQRLEHDGGRRRPGRAQARRPQATERRWCSAAQGRSASAWPNFLANEGARVRLASRSLERAQATAAAVGTAVSGSHVTGVSTASPHDVEEACNGVEVLIAAGAARAKLLSAYPTSGRPHAQGGHRPQCGSPRSVWRGSK